MSESQNGDQRSFNVGGLLMMLVGFSLIVIGGLFIFLMARSYLRAKEMREWPVIECVILESSIEQRRNDPYSPPEFSHQITYGYEWEGEALTGDRISLRGQKWSSKPQGTQKSFELYPIGSRQECHVSPDNPDLAVLELDSLAPLYSIWFPALFVVGGVGMIVTALIPRKESRSAA